MNKTAGILFSLLFAVVICTRGYCLDTGDIIRLKKAGISDKTIQSIVKEKAIETCLFTIEEILALKKAGLSDKTIRKLIDEGSFMKDTRPIVYGQDIKSLRFTTVKDVIELKDAGVNDETIRALIILGSKDANNGEREKAWEMLKNMGIMIDKR